MSELIKYQNLQVWQFVISEHVVCAAMGVAIGPLQRLPNLQVVTLLARGVIGHFGLHIRRFWCNKKHR